MAVVLLSAHPWVALIGFALVGAGLAPVAPILFNAATRVPGMSRAAALASVTSIGYSGFMIGPPLIGSIATATSLSAALGVVVLASGLLAYGARFVPEKAGLSPSCVLVPPHTGGWILCATTCGMLCGVVGFRPSPGLVPMDGRPLGWTPISVLGPMGRSVADLRMLFAAQLGVDSRDPLSRALDPESAAHARLADLGRLRVASTTDFGQCPVGAEIRGVMRRRMAAMRHLFRDADEFAFDFGEADRCFDVIRAMNFLARHKEAWDHDRDRLGPNIRVNYEMGSATSLADAAWAHAEQTRIFRRFQQTFRDYDLVLSPTVPVSPFPWTQLYLAELEGRPLICPGLLR